MSSSRNEITVEVVAAAAVEVVAAATVEVVAAATGVVLDGSGAFPLPAHPASTAASSSAAAGNGTGRYAVVIVSGAQGRRG